MANEPAGKAPCPAVLIVMGVSGSGKTTIASLLARRLEWTFEDADWFHPPENVAKMAAGTPLTDADRWPWLQAIKTWIDSTRHAGRHGVVACSALKREYRAVLVGSHPDEVRIVYLDGDRELIGTRLAMRSGHFMPPGLLESQFATLEPPGPEERPITISVEPHPNDVVTNIVAALEGETG
ncbi:gluconokinase, partial [uncultured Enterovirga sp.]|uniref:gluconokinase n=1 Tax=uncultured Enterovirga sp. TaxID=2026352 RepID=UPI0035CA9741